MRTTRSFAVAATVFGLVAMGTPSASAFIRGAHRPAPIVLERAQLRTSCPGTSPSGMVCAFWYSNGNTAVGDANWAFLNLDTWGIAKKGTCTTAGSSVLGDYILHRYPTKLGFDTMPTYVCSNTGHASNNFQDFVDILGQHRLFPVNDCSRQVDADGHVVPCGSGTPDKFAIVGYRRFIVIGVLKGNDPAAIGTPGTPYGVGTCTGQDLGLDGSNARQLDDLADVSCGAPGQIDEIPFDAASSTDPNAALSTTFKIYSVTDPGGGPVTTYYQGCLAGGSTDGCDYTYDPATFKLQWVNATSLADGATKLVSLEWIVNGTPGSPGACGIRTSDPNALCLELRVP